jgi:phenylpyruvate tautomerase PptA (4-oxalocrotonate tautomerase family)
MSIAIAYIPEGYTKEQKKIMIDGAKEACKKAFDVTDEHSFVYVEEIKRENMDESSLRMKSLFVYTTYGKTPKGKDILARVFDEACVKAFGDEKGRTIVIIKEHFDENAGGNGHTRPFQPGYGA